MLKDHRIEYAMVHPPRQTHDLRPDFDHHVVFFPTRHAPYVPSGLPAESAGPRITRPRAQVRARTIRQVAVLEVSGQLRDVVESLDQAIQVALADGPRGVVCDLSHVVLSEHHQEADDDAIEVLATAGRHVRDWPGALVVVASPDPRVREALQADPLGAHLVVTESMFTAVAAVLATPVLAVQWLRLAPHPTAPRASRNFTTRTLLDWRMGRVIPFASLVVSELVASSAAHAGTDIDVSIAWNLGALRLTVRDRGPALPGQHPADHGLGGRRLTVIAGLARTFGVLPTADGGKVVWAVLDASQPSPSSGPHRSAIARQESLIRENARSLAESSSAMTKTMMTGISPR